MTNEILNNAIGALSEDAPSGTKDLLKKISSSIRQKDMEFLDPVTFAHIASKHAELLEKHKKGTAAVSVYTPNLDTGKWGIPRTVIDVVVDDMSFIVDSLAAEINRLGHLINFLFYPVINGIAHIHIQLDGPISYENAQNLSKDLEEILGDVRLTNEDWKKMLEVLSGYKEKLKENCPSWIKKEDLKEHLEFLEYIKNHRFTFIGYKEYVFDEKEKTVSEVENSGLGVLGSKRKTPFLSDTLEGMPEKLPGKKPSLMFFTKTRKLSTVHISLPLDVIRLRDFDEKGNITGEKVYIGLFTSKVFSTAAEKTPYIRAKIQRVMKNSGLISGDHDRRALRHILEKYPRSELFQIDEKRLEEIVAGIVSLQERQKIALYIREDKQGHYVSCLVYIPRDRFDTDLRIRFVKILEENVVGEASSFYTTLDDSVFARLLVIIDVSKTDNKKRRINETEIEDKLIEAGQTWPEKLRGALNDSHENREKASYLYAKYAEAFPTSYKEQYQPFQGVCDIEKIEETLKNDNIALDLYKLQEDKNGSLRLKIYLPGADFSLSDVMPLLEDMGLHIVAEVPYQITPAGAGTKIWMHDFLLEHHSLPATFRLKEVKKKFETAFQRIWGKDVESDNINRLVLLAGMNWREIMILRTYARYMKQMRLPFSLRFIERTLFQNPAISRLLVDMFITMFDPKGKGGETEEAGYGVAIDHELEKVSSLDQDMVIRTLLNLLENTVRTNYFQPEEDGKPKPYLSIKLSSRKINNLPEPKPFMEIFVYSPRVEGVHLRGDVIARGGLRWSDREEDFRTEILGLMKAQMVKNVVIVPVGAKGGFFVKRPPAGDDRDAYQKEGIECYKIFISGLLDITDNRIGETILPPKNVIRRDEDDPYLVVAADKGTATFSDIANTISHRYGFWMGDAFASGGSTGYDHKIMGITAKGAWESVKRHFRELSHDTQSKDFEVIGVGDMGGDVFGNGMLLSKHIRLVGAFNHLHIFCDPDPDAEMSYHERLRLFNEVKGWDGYNTKTLSPGGKIYNRSDKSLQLTPAIRKRFGINRERVTPTELIKAMLTSKADLLWFGGIGTYIKASGETHSDVGDKSNDSLRVNASDLNVKVIGEGANLAITQLGRIEFAMSGGKINTDFIDNSGGVNTSDHEVNIKILFSAIMADKTNNMSISARNRLLEAMSEDVAKDVLRDNYQQAIALSLAEHLSSERLSQQAEMIRDLEREQWLNRELEGLPSEKEIKNRISLGKGLTRPELSVLLAYAKITFTQELMTFDFLDAKEMEGWLFDYFPEVIREKFAEEIKAHRLHKEIIATRLANGLINRMGPTFVKSVMMRTGASCKEVAKAYLMVLESLDIGKFWDDIESLEGKTESSVQVQILCDISSLVSNAISWFISRFPDGINISRELPSYKEGLTILSSHDMIELLPKELKGTIETHHEKIIESNVPETIAKKIALVPVLDSGFEIVRIAKVNSADFKLTSQIYFNVSERFQLKWLKDQARNMRHDSHWIDDAAQSMLEKFRFCQTGITNSILSMETNVPNSDITQEWLKNHEVQMAQFDKLISDIKNAGAADLSMLIVAEQRLRSLFEKTNTIAA